MSTERISDLAIGRWRSILPALGVPAKSLTGRHCPCPICGGKDRFRFDDKGGTGSYYCNSCGAGHGMTLAMKVLNVQYAEAARRVEAELPSTAVYVPKATRRDDDAAGMDRVASLWRTGQVLNGTDPASRYLRKRCLKIPQHGIRYTPRLSYLHEDKKTKTEHPAMLALFVAPDRSSTTVHQTFLDMDGNKAALPIVRKFVPAKIPSGGAVRLAPSAETMGVAEGLETALSAIAMFDVPVWATLTAGALIKWQPPENAKHILIFGDNDSSFTGQHAAYSLAYRLRTEGRNVEVRLPEEMGCDWNDVLAAEASRRMTGETE